jgi:hypothetical protein
VTTVTITPGDNSVLDIIEGETQTFTCTTDSSRPSALIQSDIIIIIYITVPVTTVRITPAGDNNVVDIIEGETQTFTCTTDSSRPAAWIQWYIGGQNVTNQAASQQPQQDGDKFISSSSLVYTGRDVYHNKVISCEAVNIEGRQKVKSIEKSLYIQCK